MELNEVLRRIVGQHWAFIVPFVVFWVGLAMVIHVGEATTFTASARLVLDTPDPSDRAESAAIADTAKALATSPALVRSALTEANVTGRDPTALAKERVAVRALGTSGVVQLSVTDESPAAAALLANALANRVIEARLEISGGQLVETLQEVDNQIDKLNRDITNLDARIDSLTLGLATADVPERANALRARRNEATRHRDTLTQERAILEAERVSLLSTDALRPKASVLSPASPPADADPSGQLSDMVLGGLLGLILALALAGFIETIRPTLVGSDVLAREFGTPLLGSLASEPDDDGGLRDVGEIAERVSMAAEGAGLRNVGLLATGPRRLDLLPLAQTLETASVNGGTPAQGFQRSSRGGRHTPDGWVANGVRPDLKVTPFDVHSPLFGNGSRTGLILVSPTALKKSDLIDASHLLRITPLPLIGLITFVPSRD
jgi:capsular polysaccharide biosynthesis protein